MSNWNRDRVTKSLINLNECLKEIPFNSDVNGIDTKKQRIRPCSDVLEFIEEHKKLLVWDIVGYDYENKPIYSRHIRIIREEKKENERT